MNAGAMLAVNTGSHSIELAVVAPDEHVLAHQELDVDPRGDDAADALTGFVDRADELAAVAHRVVHGGPDLLEPKVVDDELRRQLQRAVSLAPGHNPAALACLDLARRQLPDVPHVVCPDTAFHAAMPAATRTLALPQQWRKRYGLRRFGFHGVSYEWTAARTADLLDTPVEELCVVLAHLGGGCSVCAVDGGRSVWTSMGFTPADGVVMTTRSGAVDPGLLLWLQTEHGLPADELAEALQHESGLLGLTGGRSGDTRELVEQGRAGDERARLAMSVFTTSVRQAVAAAAAVLPRLDAVVFTGEIGSDQPEVREAVCGGLHVLGLQGDLDTAGSGDRIVSTARAAVPVLVVQPDEPRQLARTARSLLAAVG